MYKMPSLKKGTISRSTLVVSEEHAVRSNDSQFYSDEAQRTTDYDYDAD